MQIQTQVQVNSSGTNAKRPNDQLLLNPKIHNKPSKHKQQSKDPHQAT